jgi:hypothetical protein
LAQLFPAMDASAWRNVTRWLSSHLTNSKLAWPFWDYWTSDYTAAEPDAVHRAFMGLLVEQCARAVSALRLRSALPEGVHGAIVGEYAPVAEGMFSQGDAPLALVAQELLRRVEAREDPDDLQEWLEEEHEGVDDALQSEQWRVSLLTKAIMISGGRKTLSQMVSLIEKYRDVLREMGESGEAQKVILDGCIAVMGHDMGFAVNMLDTTIRRGVLRPIFLANYVCDETVLAKLATETHLYDLAEVAVARSLDVAQALLAKRNALLGMGLSMDADAEAGPKDYSGAVTHVMSMGGGPSTPGEKEKPADAATPGEGEGEEAITGGKRTREEDEEDGDGDDDADRSRRRRKFAEEEAETAPADAVAVAEGAPGPASELVLIDSALASALRDCRAIYSKVVVTLLLNLSRRHRELSSGAAASDDDDVSLLLDPWSMAGISLLRTVLRAFHGAQDTLAYNGDTESKVCDVDSVKFEVSDVELSVQLKTVWEAFATSKA